MDNVSTKQEFLELLSYKITTGTIINISDDIKTKCNEFANAVNTTTSYGDCGQNNLNKRLIDNYTGKICEFAVYNFLNSLGNDYGFTLDEPDCEI